MATRSGAPASVHDVHRTTHIRNRCSTAYHLTQEQWSCHRQNQADLLQMILTAYTQDAGHGSHLAISCQPKSPSSRTHATAQHQRLCIPSAQHGLQRTPARVAAERPSRQGCSAVCAFSSICCGTVQLHRHLHDTVSRPVTLRVPQSGAIKLSCLTSILHLYMAQKQNLTDLRALICCRRSRPPLLCAATPRV